MYMAMRVDSDTAKHIWILYFHFEQRTTEGADVPNGDAFFGGKTDGIQVSVEGLQQRQRRQTHSRLLRLPEERTQTSIFSDCI